MTTEKRNRSNYTEDFKQDAVALVTEQGYKISDSAGGGTTVEIDLKAEATMYHSLSASYDFDNGLTARLGVANVLDELPPRLTHQGTGGLLLTI